MIRHLSATATVLSALLCACDAGGGGGDVPGATTRDSAGIRIVENDRPQWADGREWRLSDEPFVVIRNVGRDSAHELARVNGLLRLSDGRIAVANDGSHQILFHAPDGEFLYAVGRTGSGPGEFRQIMGLHRAPADTMWVTDVGRIQVLSPTGQFVRLGGSQRSGVGSGWPVAFFDDGSILKSRWPQPRASESAQRSGKWLDSARITWISADGERTDTLPPLPATRFAVGPVTQTPLHEVFGGTFVAAHAGLRFYTGFSDRYEVRVFELRPGDEDPVADRMPLRTVIRRRVEGTPVPKELRDEYITKFLTQPGEDGRPPNPQLLERWKQIAQDFSFADVFPAYSKVRVDSPGNLWVRAYDYREQMPGVRLGLARTYTSPWPTTWDVFDPGGNWLGTVSMPASFEPLDIGDDYIGGLAHDSDEIEQVRFYRLIKP